MQTTENILRPNLRVANRAGNFSVKKVILKVISLWKTGASLNVRSTQLCTVLIQELDSEEHTVIIQDNISSPFQHLCLFSICA